MARTTIATPGFLDRLGDRVVVTDRTGGDLEVLRLRPELTADPGFETCLKARAEQLAAFTHRNAPRVRGISRLPAPDGRLAVVSDAPKGWRLSEVLQAAEHESQLIHTGTVLYILRQVASVVTALQAMSPEVAHGALGPERIVLSPGGRVLVVEYVLGTALAHLPPASPDRLWKESRIAVPHDAGGARFTPHTDVLQLGLVALSLVHNRLLRRDEYPGRLTELLDTGTESRLTGARQPIGVSLRRWLEQALGLVGDAAPWKMEDAQRGLDWIVSKEGGYFSTPVGLEPLLQSVERFFTVPAAGESASAAVAPAVPTAAETPAPKPSHEPEPNLPPVPAAARATAIPEMGDTPQARGLTLVFPPTDAAAPVPPQERATAAPPSVDPEVEVAPPKPSPFARFVQEEAEHSSDPFPVPPDLPATPAAAAAPAPPRPALRPVPAPPARRTSDSGVSDLAPVADMLSVERAPSPRRTGWNDEAWLSRSTDRTPSGARSIAAGSPAVTARLSKAGGTATAAALKPREVTSPGAEPAEAPEVRGQQDVLPQSHPSGPHAPAPASHAPTPLATAAATPREPLAVRSPGSLFSLSSASNEHEERMEEEARSSRGGRAKWLAVAAAVILCLGGFAAWTLLGPSDDAKAAPAAKTDAATPDNGVPAATPAAPGTSSAASPAAAATPAGTGNVASETPATPAPIEPAPAMGSLQIISPVVLAVSEGGQALGTSTAPVPLAAGRHVLDLANQEVGYQATQVVDVRPGRVLRITPAMPRGAVNINATPWAEVLVDGQRVGETPLGNVQMTVGSHEVRFRHPQLGEQVRTVVVTTGAPGRLSVDMKQ